MKAITSSVYSFEKLQKAGYLYVDKTEFIWKLINPAGGAYFLSRPRRYPRSIKNLFLYSEVCDQTFCFNNEQGMVASVFERTKGQPVEIIDKITYSRIMEVVNHE